MKRLLYLLTILLSAVTSRAQTTGAVVTTVPSSFTAVDQVKIIVDVSNVGNLKNKEPLYIWTWNPNDPPAGNGAWDNSREALKMVKEGPNKWSWTMTPADFYGKAPAEIKTISFLVKAKDGSGDAKTADITLNVSPAVFVATVFRTFPKFFGQNDGVTINLDQTLASDVNTQRMAPTQARIKIFAGGNQVGSEQTVTLVKQAEKQFAYSFIISRLFAIPAGVTVDKMEVVFKGMSKDANGNTINVESPVFEHGIDDLK